MSNQDPTTGPRGGVTTIAPSGWQKTSVYLRKDQVRALKLLALDRGGTMSELLRRAIDHYLELPEPLGEQVVSERLSLDDRHVDDVAGSVDEPGEVG